MGDSCKRESKGYVAILGLYTHIAAAAAAAVVAVAGDDDGYVNESVDDGSVAAAAVGLVEAAAERTFVAADSGKQQFADPSSRTSPLGRDRRKYSAALLLSRFWKLLRRIREGARVDRGGRGQAFGVLGPGLIQEPTKTNLLARTKTT